MGILSVMISHQHDAAARCRCDVNGRDTAYSRVTPLMEAIRREDIQICEVRSEDPRISSLVNPDVTISSYSCFTLCDPVHGGHPEGGHPDQVSLLLFFLETMTVLVRLS
jgi:hypothetical protein